MQITFLGHSCFKIVTGQNKIIIDPFLSENPLQEGQDIKSFYEGCTHVILTHGHSDHFGDVVEICQNTDAMLIANYDLGLWLGTKGVEKMDLGNTGGTLMQSGFSVTFTQAHHSSAFIDEHGTSHCLGNANGVVLHFGEGDDAGKSLYHMGDTDIFGDMALIEELHQPKIGIVPIGDRFTMGGAVAALACQRYFNFETIIPCHFKTFPILAQDAKTFEVALGEGAKAIKVPQLNSAFEL